MHLTMPLPTTLLFYLATILTTTTAERPTYRIAERHAGSYTPSEHHERDPLSQRGSGNADFLQTSIDYLHSRYPGIYFRPNGDYHTSFSTGLTHIYFTQTYNSLDIINARANVNLKSDGAILSSGSSFLERTIYAPTAIRRQTLVSPVEALQSVIVARNYSMKATGARAVPYSGTNQSKEGPKGGESYIIEGTEGTLSKPKAQLVYYAVAGHNLKLVWRLETDMGQNWMVTFVDALNKGLVYGAVDYVSDNWAPPSRIDVAPAGTGVGVDGTAKFRVYKFGLNDPSEGQRTLQKNPWYRDASPNGWQVAGTRTYTTTRGNNGIAQENWEGGDDFENNERPDAGPTEDFDYPYDQDAEDPHEYIDAAVTQLYYTANMMHDLLEELGFDEASGNFEETDTKPGGKGHDAVQLNAQDGSGINNANFATPPDGLRPRMNMFLWTTNGLKDGDFDAGIVIHEYLHGMSTRLTGGPSTSDCLNTDEAAGLGEGWGDFYATAIRIKPNDTNSKDYSLGDWSYGPKGIRPYPYSTNLARNPVTYQTLNDPEWQEPHAAGTVWAEMLYEVMWNLNDKYGYAADPFPKYENGSKVPSKGRQLAMKLVLEGMKLQPCNPTFLAARDAILDADKALTGGVNRCEIWKGFAKRGLGSDARQGDGENHRVPGFSVPSNITCSGGS